MRRARHGSMTFHDPERFGPQGPAREPAHQKVRPPETVYPDRTATVKALVEGPGVNANIVRPRQDCPLPSAPTSGSCLPLLRYLRYLLFNSGFCILIKERKTQRTTDHFSHVAVPPRNRDSLGNRAGFVSQQAPRLVHCPLQHTTYTLGFVSQQAYMTIKRSKAFEYHSAGNRPRSAVSRTRRRV
jgi:hypothetical protein